MFFRHNGIWEGWGEWHIEEAKFVILFAAGVEDVGDIVKELKGLWVEDHIRTQQENVQDKGQELCTD